MGTEIEKTPARPAGSKKNTAIFIAVATIVNLVLIIGFSFLGLLLFAWIFPDPGKGAGASLTLFLLCFLLPIVLSWVVYNFLVKLATKKFHLEDRMAPLFKRRRR